MSTVRALNTFPQLCSLLVVWPLYSWRILFGPGSQGSGAQRLGDLARVALDWVSRGKWAPARGALLLLLLLLLQLLLLM